MAGVPIVALSSAISVAESATKAIAMLKAATNHRVVLRSVDVRVDGGAPDETVRVEICTYADDGSGSSSLTVSKRDPGMSETVQTTAIQGPTTEPATPVPLLAQEVSANQGRGFFNADRLPIPGGGRLGVRIVNAPAAITVRANFEAEE